MRILYFKNICRERCNPTYDNKHIHTESMIILEKPSFVWRKIKKILLSLMNINTNKY